MIGTILGGRYKILEEVGKGGMAYVYKAHCNVLNRIVAVKMLRNDLEGGDEFVNRFNAEAQSAACLTHPNIVSIFDVGEEDGMYYIVMEYLDGTTLKEYIKSKGRLSSAESADIASQICSALMCAHEKNIIHRDIKPHNIMITGDNLVKVTDFGIARASSNATMQVGDSILGSVHYISPEQARGGYVDCRSDIYSLGIVLYEMLTGKVPFESDSPIAIAMKHLEETPVQPKLLSPDISDELQEVVLKAISKETRKRYQNVAAMKSDLDTIITMLKTLPAESDEIMLDEDADMKIVSSLGEAYDIEAAEENINIDSDDTSDTLENDEPDYDESDDTYIEDDYSEEYDKDDDEYDEYDEEYDEPQKRSVFNMVLAAILIALVVVGGSSLALLYSFNPDAPIFTLFKNNDVDIPDFMGLTFEEAEALAAQYGLLIEIGDEESSPYPEGTVIYQSKNKGNSVKKGTQLTVHLSTGPEKLDPDSYRGLSDSVIDDFIEKGYDVDVKYKTDAEISKGRIIDVEQNGNKIIFTVSNGSGDIDCVVPDLLNLTEAEAREKLEDNGLRLNGDIKYLDSDTVEEGKVVQQSIDPGEKVAPKTKITIYLASKDGNSDEEEKPSSETKVKEKTFNYSTEALQGPTKVKIVEKSSDGSTKTIFEQTVDPATLDEIVVKVKGTKVNEYSVYLNGEFSLKSQIDFSR